MSTTLNLQTFLNERGFSPYQWMIFICCFLTAFFDGMDTAVIGYVAPHLLQDWGLEKAQLSPVLSAALFGLAIGALASGPIADRFGRKPVLVVAVLLFSLMCIACAYAQNLSQLEWLRFLTGLGLGAAMPNAITLLSEYCPDDKRSLIVNTMACGFPLGAAIGGFLAAWLIPTFGWRSVFWVCGGTPLLLAIFMLFTLPRSVRYLLSHGKPAIEVWKVLRRISPSLPKETQFVMIERQIENMGEKRGIALVLSRHYLLGSVMLWFAYFFGLIIFYSMVNWLPVLFQEAKMPETLGPRIVGLFALGGLGAIFSGWLMDRFNANKLIAFCAFLTALSVIGIGFALNYRIEVLVAVVLIAGVLQNTMQTSLPALAAAFYPTAGRTTGVSFMLGVGRFGAIAGTFLTGWLISQQLSFTHIFMILSIPSLLVMSCILIKEWFYQ
ncbi:MFS transporter [Suttonella ornithocola]|uniref:4-hydroxybenzoate transporter PcaK n=1 Tax=Suttonella ornithocola TaxID=279832 RepID=A0A380MZ26_9GAMM|nr:MFS transporter [Suttonella ornithocola]SUO97276.1 4-hydroxybenzoate transporter PcaK [Suttonella ornithocola]